MLRASRALPLLSLLIAAIPLAACGGSGGSGTALTAATAPVATGGVTTGESANSPVVGTPSPSGSPKVTTKPRPKPKAAGKPLTHRSAPVSLAAGNPAGHAAVPVAGQAASVAHPAHVIGHGSPAGCTSAAVLRAVAAGGVITFDCGSAPVTITLTATAKLVNAHPDVVLDGGGKVTLSGGGRHRILYEDTCDQAQGWSTSHCQDQAHPTLTVQHLTLAEGNSTGQTAEGGGGGAIFDRGGRLKVVDSVFVRNRCDSSGPDLGGAAVRALSQSGGLPVYVVGSTFGGAAGQGGICSNGGALSSIGVSWVVIDSLFSHNSAIGHGANPQRSGTPGGGSGGAIYTDGNTYTVTVAGTRIEDNHANEGGGALFFVSNDHTGSLRISGSTLHANPNTGFQTQGYPGIFYLGVGSHPIVSGSTLN